MTAISAIDTAPARFVIELLEFFRTSYKEAQGFEYPPVHDPCAIALVIDPTVMDCSEGFPWMLSSRAR